MDRRVTGLVSKPDESHVLLNHGGWVLAGKALVLASTWMLLLTAYLITVAYHRTDDRGLFQ